MKASAHGGAVALLLALLSLAAVPRAQAKTLKALSVLCFHAHPERAAWAAENAVPHVMLQDGQRVRDYCFLVPERDEARLRERYAATFKHSFPHTLSKVTGINGFRPLEVPPAGTAEVAHKRRLRRAAVVEKTLSGREVTINELQETAAPAAAVTRSRATPIVAEAFEALGEPDLGALFGALARPTAPEALSLIDAYASGHAADETFGAFVSPHDEGLSLRQRVYLYLHEPHAALMQLRALGDAGCGCDIGDPEVEAGGAKVLLRRPGVGRDGCESPLAPVDHAALCGFAATAILSAWPGITSVERYEYPSVQNGEAAWVVQSGLQDYRPIWDAGVLGDGQVIGLGDTGLDRFSCFFRDEDRGAVVPSDLNNAQVDAQQRKVVQYITWSSGNVEDTANGHGTHVAGSAVGRLAGSENPGDNPYEGVALDAKVAFFDLQGDGLSGSSSLSIPGNLRRYFAPAHDVAGARVHSNSWGSSVAATYSSDARESDDFAVNNDGMLIVYAAGNCGSPGTGGCAVTAAGSVLSPSFAKNVVAVGASHTGDGAYTFDIDRIAFFSSQGCADYAQDAANGGSCRIKPDIVAPGYVVKSASADPNGASCGVHASQGTSMATPVVAGAAALIRDYLAKGFYPGGSAEPANAMADPSGSLVKAMLIASAVPVGFLERADRSLVPLGLPPDNVQGHGRVQLDNVLHFDGLRLFLADRVAIAEGEAHTYELLVIGTDDGTSTLDVDITATLVWADPLGSSSEISATNIVNDLDVNVTDAVSGAAWFPNGLAGPDRANNAEKVYFTPLLGRRYTVTVAAPRIGSGTSQDYSLVVTGDFAEAPGLVAPPTSPPVPAPTPYPTFFPTAVPTEPTELRVRTDAFFCSAASPSRLEGAAPVAFAAALHREAGVNVDAADVMANAIGTTADGALLRVSVDFVGDASGAAVTLDAFENSLTLGNYTVQALADEGVAASCATFTNSSSGDRPSGSGLPEDELTFGGRAGNALDYFRTGVGLSTVSGFALFVVLVLLAHSMLDGCCGCGSREHTSIVDMRHLWAANYDRWRDKQRRQIDTRRKQRQRLAGQRAEAERHMRMAYLDQEAADAHDAAAALPAPGSTPTGGSQRLRASSSQQQHRQRRPSPQPAPPQRTHRRPHDPARHPLGGPQEAWGGADERRSSERRRPRQPPPPARERGSSQGRSRAASAEPPQTARTSSSGSGRGRGTSAGRSTAWTSTTGESVGSAEGGGVRPSLGEARRQRKAERQKRSQRTKSDLDAMAAMADSFEDREALGTSMAAAELLSGDLGRNPMRHGPATPTEARDSHSSTHSSGYQVAYGVGRPAGVARLSAWVNRRRSEVADARPAEVRAASSRSDPTHEARAIVAANNRLRRAERERQQRERSQSASRRDPQEGRRSEGPGRRERPSGGAPGRRPSPAAPAPPALDLHGSLYSAAQDRPTRRGSGTPRRRPFSPRTAEGVAAPEARAGPPQPPRRRGSSELSNPERRRRDSQLRKLRGLGASEGAARRAVDDLAQLPGGPAPDDTELIEHWLASTTRDDLFMAMRVHDEDAHDNGGGGRGRGRGRGGSDGAAARGKGNKLTIGREFSI